MSAAVSGNVQALRVAVVDEWSPFEQLSTEWDALLARSGARVYFLRHSWNLRWWKHYAPAGAGLHILTCRDHSGRLVGLAPIYRRRVRLLGVAHVRELVFLGMGIELKTSENLDIIAASGHEAAVADALARHLINGDTWDRLWLHQVPASSPILPHLANAFAGHRVTTTPCDRAPYIDTSRSWQAFKETLGRSMRRNVEYYPRRLQKHHAVELRLAVTPAETEDAMHHLVRLHQARWNARRESGAFNYPEFEPFMREMAHDGIRSGTTRLWTLTLDGTVQAALLGFLDAGVLHYFQKGFNPAFAAQELGNVMLALCVRACCADPDVCAFNFMGGGAPYKDLWARHARHTVTVEVQRANSRAVLYEVRRRLHHKTVALLRAVTPMSVREARRDYLKRRIRDKR